MTLVVSETLAARTTMTLAVELHLDRVLFEGDLKIIINALQSSEASCASYGHLISETQNIASQFYNVNFTHARRTANQVAHVLAKKSYSLETRIVWLSHMPPDVISTLHADLVF